ncbi:UNVERIFIED_CONTAM: hypothetical protein Slati_4526000 [Sesamum latifolium]|uniref:Uncharacterized protein n=1 Tax=Sesamum latifolium TaxID=2727402 RepID=A0AAW2SGP7_9LAMI
MFTLNEIGAYGPALNEKGVGPGSKESLLILSFFSLDESGMRFFHQAKWDSSKQEGKLLYPSFFHRFFGQQLSSFLRSTKSIGYSRKTESYSSEEDREPLYANV